jgi:putative Mg2+ transporter-C (MgtC) family protein
MNALIDFFSIDPFTWKALGSAILCGMAIGLERQYRGKPAGMRTSILIVLGTYLFVSISMLVATDISDPSRIIGQVVTGIGFLGAGVILAKEGLIIGVTSAATIWALAAIGVCIALISEAVAIKLSFIVVAILSGVDVLEVFSSKLTQGVHTRYSDWRKS